jgi:hypothetical protein
MTPEIKEAVTEAEAEKALGSGNVEQSAREDG